MNSEQGDSGRNVANWLKNHFEADLSTIKTKLKDNDLAADDPPVRESLKILKQGIKDLEKYV